MLCEVCQHENRPSAKFCEECAAPATVCRLRRVRLYLSLLNWGEVMYIVRRDKGEVAGHARTAGRL